MYHLHFFIWQKLIDFCEISTFMLSFDTFLGGKQDVESTRKTLIEINVCVGASLEQKMELCFL